MAVQAGGPAGGGPGGDRGTGARGALGAWGEELAARRLTEAGMTVLDRNWRGGRTGEIDIVARDGDAVVVCEVKTRRAPAEGRAAFEHPMAAVTPAKAARLRGLAERWVQEHGGAPPGGVRIDVVGVLLPRRGAPQVEHVRGVA
ncbi:YraN family protein [Streptomyces sp. NPDC056600]|uniref:YraN family protein n=1 Tax=Streptomyces sp. NPDC056600 TaxID=3345874 RepID=UPI0036855162